MNTLETIFLLRSLWQVRCMNTLESILRSQISYAFSEMVEVQQINQCICTVQVYIYIYNLYAHEYFSIDLCGNIFFCSKDYC